MNEPAAVQTLRERCRVSGFDLVHAFGAGSLREELALLSGPALAEGENPCAALVANTKALWQPFLEAIAGSPKLQQASHPLDTWTELVVGSAARATGEIHSIVWAHRALPGGYAPLQRWSAESGWGSLAPCNLLVHPEHGPWVGVRALVLFSFEWCGPALATEGPCERCCAPCLPPFERAAELSKDFMAKERVTGLWRTWLQVRDACPTGSGSRYGEQQIRYHYARDRSVLLTKHS